MLDGEHWEGKAGGCFSTHFKKRYTITTMGRALVTKSRAFDPHLILLKATRGDDNTERSVGQQTRRSLLVPSASIPSRCVPLMLLLLLLLETVNGRWPLRAACYLTLTFYHRSCCKESAIFVLRLASPRFASLRFVGVWCVRWLCVGWDGSKNLRNDQELPRCCCCYNNSIIRRPLQGEMFPSQPLAAEANGSITPRWEIPRSC